MCAAAGANIARRAGGALSPWTLLRASLLHGGAAQAKTPPPQAQGTQLKIYSMEKKPTSFMRDGRPAGKAEPSV